MDNKIVCIAGKNRIAIECHRYILTNFPSLKTMACINSTDVGKNDWQPSYSFFCQKNGIPIHVLENCYAIENLIFFSLEFDKIIRTEKFRTEALFNIHFSLLPKYKGMYTSALPILHGETESGVTLHCIDNGIDTGDIIDQKKIEISINENAEDLYNKYIEVGIELFKRNFVSILNQDFKASSQSPFYSSYYSKAQIDYRNGINIDLNTTAFQLHNQLRAFNFRKFQLPLVYGHQIHRSEISNFRCFGKPGAIIFEDDIKLTVNTIDYFIDLYKDKLDEIILAAQNGDVDTLRLYASNGYRLNEKNQLGWDILIVSSYNEQFEVVKFILEYNICPVDSTNFKGTTALMYAMTSACKSNRTDILELLLSFGADIKLRDDKGKDIIDYVTEYNNATILKYLTKLL